MLYTVATVKPGFESTYKLNKRATFQIVNMFRLAILCVMVVSTWAAEVCYDRGDAGTICDRRYCPSEEGVCVDTECQCTTGRGQPELLCANDEDYFASVLNDPNAWTMNNREEAELPVPCQYLFSRVSTKTKSHLSPNGRCDIQVNFNNQRIRGKTFVGGFEINIKCTNMAMSGGVQDNVYKADFHVNNEGKYCFNLQASTNGGRTFSTTLESRDINIDWAPYTFKVEPTTSRVHLQVPVAGITVLCRPYDPQYNVANQKWLPGCAIKYDLAKEPSFLSEDSVVSLVPGLTLHGAAGNYRSSTDELTYRAFTGPGNKQVDFPNYSSKCSAVKTALLACPGQDAVTDTMDMCRFILAKPKFVNCYGTPNSGEVDRMLTLYEDCISAFCGQNMQKCAAIKRTLQNLPSSCKENTPDEIMEHSCMFNVL